MPKPPVLDRAALLRARMNSLQVRIEQQRAELHANESTLREFERQYSKEMRLKHNVKDK